MNDVTLDFKGKRALVTGASRGIGRAIALELGKRGASLILMARTVGALEALDDEIKSFGIEGQDITLIPHDLRKLDELDMLGPQLAEKFGGLDLFIGCAGMLGALTPTGHIQPRKWQDVMAVNLEANMRLIRTLEPLLRASSAGRVVFPTSPLAREPQAYWGAFAASKAGLEALAKSFAAEIDPKASPLRVNMVSFEAVQTALMDDAFPGGYPQLPLTPEQAANSMVPLLSEDVARHGEIVDAPLKEQALRLVSE